MSNMSGKWAIAIFAARETPSVLAETTRAAIFACSGRQATIDVLINGNPTLAAQFADTATSIATGHCNVRIWAIAAPDKAHTWNEYVHRIWDDGSLAFFIDGYARVKPGALEAIELHLAAKPLALAASGVPTCGRSAKKLRERMLRSGGIHGNLYALRGATMQALRDTGFRLPLGLYRTDPMLGAALTYRLDPANNQWTKGSVVAVAGATWDVEGISDFNYKNVMGYFKRRMRQAHGVLESQAFREHMSIKRLSPQTLPATAQQMVNDWLAKQPEKARSLFLKNPSCLYAAYKQRTPRDWAMAQVEPMLLRIHTTNPAASGPT